MPDQPTDLIRCRYNSKKRFVWQLFATFGGREYFAHQWFKRPSQKKVKNTIGANWSDATAFRLSEGSTVTRGKWKRVRRSCGGTRKETSILKNMPDEIEAGNETNADEQRVSPTSALVLPRFAVLRLTDLKLIKCQYKDELQEAIRALRTRDIGYVALAYHAGAEMFVQLEAHE